MRDYKKIVVKVGTNVLTDTQGNLDISVIQSIAKQIATLKKTGIKVILVSSGAVGAGKASFQLQNVKDDTIQRQVYSAIGQVKLMNLYSNFFKEHNMYCAQVLATKEDFAGGSHYENMKNCFKGMLLDDIIPIVNENDVVSLKELMFTDNDELAGLTAFLIEAEALIILSNIDGFYNGHPKDPAAQVISNVRLSENPEQFVQTDKSSQGRGGMQSKLDTAIRCTSKSIDTILANGKRADILLDIIKGNFVGTTFYK